MQLPASLHALKLVADGKPFAQARREVKAQRSSKRAAASGRTSGADALQLAPSGATAAAQTLPPAPLRRPDAPPQARGPSEGAWSAGSGPSSWGQTPSLSACSSRISLGSSVDGHSYVSLPTPALSLVSLADSVGGGAGHAGEARDSDSASLFSSWSANESQASLPQRPDPVLPRVYVPAPFPPPAVPRPLIAMALAHRAAEARAQPKGRPLFRRVASDPEQGGVRALNERLAGPPASSHGLGDVTQL